MSKPSRQSDHKHAWTMSLHLDGCHYYTSSYVCRCGATATRTDERSPKADPYSMVWMEPAYETVNRDKRGRFVTPHVEEVVCERCGELQAGAPTRHDLVIVAKGGQVELERHDEHEQREDDEEEAE